MDQSESIQLTAMAVDPTYQRQGLGRTLVENSLDILRESFPDRRTVWCNARHYAVPFYTVVGFTVSGDRFDIPDVGPHFIMWRTL